MMYANREKCGLLKLAKTMLLAGLLYSSVSQAQLASFDAGTNVLTLNTVAVGGQYYSGVGLYFPPGQSWSVVGSPRQISPLVASDAAIYANNQLTVPRVQIGNLTYDNFILSLPVGGAMGIATMGAVSSASSPGYQDVSFPIRSRIKNSTETDSGGELTYALTNGQVWKHVVDEPCMPGGIGTSDPDGYSDIEIYPNPGASGSAAANEGNFRFVTYYPSKAEATLVETCIVSPVSGVFGVAHGPTLNTLAVSVASVSGGTGERRSIYISGGSPPYFVITDKPGIANFWLQPNGSELMMELTSIGQATLTVYDFNRSSTQINIETTAAPAPSSPEVIPSSIDSDAFVEWKVVIFNGVPPYRLFNNPAPDFMQIGDINQAAGGSPAYFIVKLFGFPQTDIKAPVVLADSLDQLVSLPITIKSNADGYNTRPPVFR